MTTKRYKLAAAEIRDLATGYGGCIATDMITVDGRAVRFMYREEPSNEQDSGWRFTSGFESDAYMADADNHGVYDVNTIANCDPDIIPYLDAPAGSAFERPDGGRFVAVKVTLPGEGPGGTSPRLHPDFPMVEGSYTLTEEWALDLPGRFNRRTEDGDLVIWRPGVTFWIAVWGAEDGKTPVETLAWLLEGASPERKAQKIEKEGPVTRLTYRLEESDPERKPSTYAAIHGYVIGPESHVQISAYCDSPEAERIGAEVIASVRLANTPTLH
jgi:hypothetical protein